MEMLGCHLKGTIYALIASKTTPKATSKKCRKSDEAEAIAKEAIALSNRFSGLLMNAGDAKLKAVTPMVKPKRIFSIFVARSK